jgi:hypothetical protein
MNILLFCEWKAAALKVINNDKDIERVPLLLSVLNEGTEKKFLKMSYLKFKKVAGYFK